MRMTAYMYILECADGSFYVGSTRDVAARFDQHNSGLGAEYTRTRRPVELVYAAEFETIQEAYAAERKVHGWGRAKRRALIAGRFDLLHTLSKRGFRPLSDPVPDLARADD